MAKKGKSFDEIKVILKDIYDVTPEKSELAINVAKNEEEILEVTSHFEPVLSCKEQDYAHQAFNNLFLIFDYDILFLFYTSIRHLFFLIL